MCITADMTCRHACADDMHSVCCKSHSYHTNASQRYTTGLSQLIVAKAEFACVSYTVLTAHVNGLRQSGCHVTSLTAQSCEHCIYNMATLGSSGQTAACMGILSVDTRGCVLRTSLCEQLMLLATYGQMLFHLA